jgi:hypothetical protein
MKKTVILILAVLFQTPAHAANLSMLDCSSTALSEKFSKMMSDDQSIRVDFLKAQEAYRQKPSSEASNEFDRVYKIAKNIDTSNQKDLSAIMSQCGWRTIVSEDAAVVKSAFLIIQHASGPYRQKYYSFVKTAYETKKLDEDYYAMYINRSLSDKGLSQKYLKQLRSEKLALKKT